MVVASHIEKGYCSTCLNEAKTGMDYPCRACRQGDKYVAAGMVPAGYDGGGKAAEAPGRARFPAFPVGAAGVVQKRERDPLGTEAHAPGAKFDAGKVLAGVLADFSLALLAVAEVGTHGAEKYSRGGWQSVPEGETRYKDADWRHLLKGRHEATDPDSGLLHEAHRAWNVLAALELRLRREKGK